MKRLTPFLALLSGCATLSSARPLAPGEHEVGVTIGGPVLLFGGAPVPLPNAVVQGRSGVAELGGRPLDIDYGVNATAAAFYIAQGHLGVSHLLLDQNGAAPALAFTNRFWFGLDIPHGDQLEGPPHALFIDQLEVNASWDLDGQLLHVGLAQYLDVNNPALTLTPSLGAAFDPAPASADGVRLHVETRWYGLTQQREIDTVRFVGGGQGMLGFSFGISGAFGHKEGS